MINPCVDYCFHRLNRMYTEDCNTKCEFAISVRKNKSLEHDIVRIAIDRDEAVNCIREIKMLLEYGNQAGAMNAIAEYNRRRDVENNG